MMTLQRSLCLLFVGWLSVSAGPLDARRSTTQRVRAARCLRLELDHHADLSHEGESHSLDAHYAHHQALEAHSGALAPAALVVGGTSTVEVDVAADGASPARPEPSFLDELSPAPPTRAILRTPRDMRGRAPPEPVC